LNYNRIDFDGKRTGSGDASVNGLTLNGVWRAGFANKWHWVAAIGAGLGEISDYSTKKYAEFYGLARLGAEYDLIAGLALGAHAQFNYLPESSGDAPSEVHALSYLVSLSYAFGGGHHDHGHAQKVSASAPTPAVSAPEDSDGDGVANEQDKCLGTPAGVTVNAYGCQESEKAQIRLNLNFLSGKAVVTDDQLPQIEELAKFMKDYPQTKVQIEGHTDKTGSEAINKRLSGARASAVMKTLVDRFGIERSRLRSEGFGSSKPIDSNDSEDGRKANRRVVATVSGQ
jgi:outer membrane protein OmpA-like peptidoglycan-associated protein